MSILLKTGERMTPEKDTSPKYQMRVLRHLFAYKIAEKYIDDAKMVLEAGCGEGYGTNLLANKAKAIIGLDVDGATIKQARTKYQKKNCSFKTYDGKEFPFANNSFDVVISFQVLEHIKNDQSYLAEIARVLKADGRLILTTPNKANRLAPGQKPWNRFHVREYTDSELHKVLAGYFKSITIQGVQGSPEIQKQELARVRRLSKLAKIDPFKIRKILPASVLEFISAKTDKSDQSETRKYVLKDYFVQTPNATQALDWIAICVK